MEVRGDEMPMSPNSDGVLNMIPPIIRHIFSGGRKWIQMAVDMLPNDVVLIGLRWI